MAHERFGPIPAVIWKRMGEMPMFGKLLEHSPPL